MGALFTALTIKNLAERQMGLYVSRPIQDLPFGWLKIMAFRGLLRMLAYMPHISQHYWTISFVEGEPSLSKIAKD